VRFLRHGAGTVGAKVEESDPGVGEDGSAVIARKLPKEQAMVTARRSV
jgi:hypothetical protein